jgi:biopolymer transport protein ExbD
VNKTVYLGSEPVREAILEERVRQKMETAVKKDVFLRGDGGLNLSEVMKITDMLKAAGVEHVGLETRTPEER